MSAPTTATPEAPEALEQGTSLGHDAWLRLRKNQLAVFGLACLAVVSVLCLIGPWLLPYGYEEQKLSLIHI
jgi:oligopeptide transport system permease protein